ncbi:YwiC-like family protein [Pannus brasiliensis CCIBt3594]|uniref:YwiC-like family protein n=1 Tax=Pannus brasiliensis CCIBt3594 TaxID=1427578 RepID=A0AAW9QV45_9CHRO
MQTTIAPSRRPNSGAWYRPTLSPEHGVYMILFVSFLTGAAAAGRWTVATTLASVCAFGAFQAEHPWILQIKQRKSWKPRFLVWGSFYSAIAVGLASFLWARDDGKIWLSIVYTGAGVAFIFDAISVTRRQQKSVFNELITFAAVCLSAPFAYRAGGGEIARDALSLWLLNSLFFSSTIFLVKFRKAKDPSIGPIVLFHSIATAIVVALGWVGWLSPVAVAAFGIAPWKALSVVWQRDRYRSAKIGVVAMLETISALLFLAIVALSFLPPHL